FGLAPSSCRLPLKGGVMGNDAGERCVRSALLPCDRVTAWGSRNPDAPGAAGPSGHQDFRAALGTGHSRPALPSQVRAAYEPPPAAADGAGAQSIPSSAKEVTSPSPTTR
ncbi:MAG: hypothetical protein OXU61_00890, partial [Gammaproteobacteria bacterium]|nr:hypothetical protein [Gammaproteobacteria bacterium]